MEALLLKEVNTLDDLKLIGVSADGNGKRINKASLIEVFKKKETVLFTSSGGAISGNIGANWRNYKYLEIEASGVLTTFILKVDRVTPDHAFSFFHSKNGHIFNSSNLTIKTNGDFSQSFIFTYNYVLNEKTAIAYQIYKIIGVNNE